MKKYEITDIAHPDNPNLHRIRAVTDLTENVLAGMLGGYVESRDNLDQAGRAWISADAIACENAVVCGDAILTDHAVAKGCAYVGKNAAVTGDMQCGCCDERLYWHPKTNQWFCRRCGMWAKPLRAEETSAAIAEKLCWLRQNPEIIHTPEGQANVQSVEVALLDREIWQALTNAEPDVDALVAKILHRAEMEYKFCTEGDADPVTLQIQKACAEYKPTEEFPETFYKEVISKVILYRDTHIEFKLQNGQIV